MQLRKKQRRFMDEMTAGVNVVPGKCGDEEEDTCDEDDG